MSSDRFRFNRKVVLEDSQPQPDGAGGYQQSWVALGEHWASFAAFGGKTSEQGGAAVSSQSYRISLRAAPAGSSDRPRPGQRFREGGRLFRIEAVREADASGKYLTCQCFEEVAP